MFSQPDRRIDSWRSDFCAAAGDRPDLAAFGPVWPLAYLAEATPARAVADAAMLVDLEPDSIRVVGADEPAGRLRLTVQVAGHPLSLGDMLPGLQSLGLDVLAEQPYSLVRPDGLACWLYDFTVQAPARSATGGLTRRIERTLLAAWSGRTETDSFNRLITVAGTDWQEASLMRAYGQYLHQLGVPWGRTYTAEVLADHPEITARLIALFHRRFRPAGNTRDDPDATGFDDAGAEIERSVDAVENLTADRILRTFLTLIRATVRTNFYRGMDGGTAEPERAIALKLAPESVPTVPAPRPRFEVFVSSPRIEGVHLRFGPVARGGLRWSDRPEDLRTEILGLATAQVAKNAVIVPTGAKGGFVLKRGLGPAAAPDGPAGYREFISALLDVHDNLDPTTGQPIPQPDTVVHEGTDAYLVVAADKGTASFSDIANEIATARGFWLGDAFASGGSAGYDHKAIGITARGAWRSVRRHFRELGLDPDTNPFTAVGIGDMSGDVFGNGMLLSRNLRLVAAFDHRHIFLDPDPDPAVSYAERSRLFAVPRSSWADYDLDTISPGGGVFSRGAKSIPITAPVAAALGLDPPPAALAPTDLIRAILTAPVDLLWNGGIGTYVKATGQPDTDAGDKVNDAVRVDAARLRARVVGEGGNLGLTQQARIEYARLGGKINTDSIDNSAGVGCSDREVNIKIALTGRPALSPADRDKLLGAMTDDVCRLVLAENTGQNELLGQSRQFAGEDASLHGRIIGRLESSLGIDRTLLALPGDAELATRARDGRGLSSPELSVLIAQVKRDLRAQLIADDLPDDPAVRSVLIGYFPTALQTHPADLLTHPLRREIIATELTNRVINQAGIGYVHRMMENANVGAGDAVRAFLVITAVFDLPQLWDRIQAAPLRTETAGQLLRESLRLLDSGSRWLLRNRPQPIDVGGETARLRPVVAELATSLPELLTVTDLADRDRRLQAVPDAVTVDRDLAFDAFDLIDEYCLLDISEIARQLDLDPFRVAQMYFRLKDRRHINALLADVADLPRQDRWTALARIGLHDDLYEAARDMCVAVLAGTDQPVDADTALDAWEARLGNRLTHLEAVVTAARGAHDLVHLGVAARHIHILSMLSTHPAGD